MSGKAEILKAVRSGHAPDAALPNLQGDWIRYADPFAQFRGVIEGVGGRCLRVANLAEAARVLADLPDYQSAEQIVSTLPDFSANIAVNEIHDPHELIRVDWAILPAEFGVAENGAIWVTDQNLRHRAIYIIVQHLALVLPTSQIVNNMHEAYERVTVGQSSWGGFISGPSKTADIEQSLVIGAHGPRSLTVFCVD